MARPKKARGPSNQASIAVPDGMELDDDEEKIDIEAPPPPPIPSEPLGPIVESYTYASAVPTECSKLAAESGSGKVPCVLGVDEAGRGPVLGPLVYGIAYCPVAYQDSLKEIGFADSKALTAERRDALLEALINEREQLGWAVRVMSPQDISAGMLRRRPVNLNVQSCQATVELIAGVLERGVDVTEIYVDTVGDPKSYSRQLSSHFPRHPHIKWTVTSKADAIYPIVGAASIATKVTRDRCIAAWKYAEEVAAHLCDAGDGAGALRLPPVLADSTNTPQEDLPDRNVKKRKADADDADEASSAQLDTVERGVWTRLGASGSGYPGDPNTVAYLKRTLDPVFGWPGIVRFSWATAKTMMEDKSRPPPTGTSTASHGRQSRSSSRTQSLTDAPSDHAAAVQHTASRSIFGTPLPIGPTATRTYKVRWMDEPVKISKFFGKLSKSAAQTTAPHPGPDPDPEDPFRVSEAQQAVDAFLRQEPEWRAKNTPALASPMVGKLQRDLGHTSSGANFLTSPR